VRCLSASIWRQGIRSNYRSSYWKFLFLTVTSFWRSPAKLWVGFSLLLSAEHFLLYSKVVIDHLEEEAEKVDEAARRAVGSTSDELVGVQAVS
jgi:hypothetical protein